MDFTSNMFVTNFNTLGGAPAAASDLMAPAAPKKFDSLASSFFRQRRQNIVGFNAADAAINNNSNSNSNNNAPSTPTDLVSDLDRVLDILDSAEDIVTEATSSAPAYVEGTPETPGFDLEPTPIGPQGVRVLVPEFPLTETHSMEQVKDDLLDVLNPLLAQPPPAKRRRSENVFPATISSSGGNSNSNSNSSTNTSPLLSSPVPAAVVSTVTTPETTSDEERFRPYQSDQWKDRFQDLIEFRKENGHCLVPHNFPENQQLAQWIKRQRYQYKLKQMNRHSTLTDERQAALEKMGFVWDSHKAAWIERFESLKQFRAQHGHCSVPSNYTDRSLAIWVKCQRRQYKLYQQGSRSTMTQERFTQLELLGFDWNPRNL